MSICFSSAPRSSKMALKRRSFISLRKRSVDYSVQTHLIYRSASTLLSKERKSILSYVIQSERSSQEISFDEWRCGSRFQGKISVRATSGQSRRFDRYSADWLLTVPLQLAHRSYLWFSRVKKTRLTFSRMTLSKRMPLEIKAACSPPTTSSRDKS